MTAPGVQAYFIQQAPQSANLVLGLNISIIHLGLALGAGAGGMIVNTASTVVYHPMIASFTYALGLAMAVVSFSMRKRIVSNMA